MTATEYWAGRGATVEGEGPQARVVHAGDAAADAKTAWRGEATCLVPLLGVTPLRLTGPDRAAFLHGQLSNAVDGLAAGACNHTLQLDARGRVVGEARLCVRREDLLLCVEDGRGARVRRSLETHIVFDDVEIEDLGGALTALTLQGPGALPAAARVFGEAPAEGRFAASDLGAGAERSQALLVRRRRSPAGGVDVHLPVGQLPAAVAALEAAGAVPVGEGALDVMRVLAGVPSAAREAPDGALPQELGLASAVSFEKGCYLGQEIMARLEARGAVRRGLARLRLEGVRGDVEAGRLEGLPVRQGEREVGRLGTVATLPGGDLAALAVLRLALPAQPDLEILDGAGRAASATAWPRPAAGRGSDDGARAAGRVQPGGRTGPEL